MKKLFEKTIFVEPALKTGDKGEEEDHPETLTENLK
jgi:hypothetical protein